MCGGDVLTSHPASNFGRPRLPPVSALRDPNRFRAGRLEHYVMVNGQLQIQPRQQVQYFYDSNPIDSGFRTRYGGGWRRWR
jgi:hypothetical protein